jgi:class 3 adenylate cyclase/Tfp pilus assembly protein PilF
MNCFFTSLHEEFESRAGYLAVRKTSIGLFTFLLFCTLSGFSQKTLDVDSLEQVYLRGDFATADSLELLDLLSVTFQDPQKVLQYSEALIQVAQRQDSVQRLWQGYLQKGNGLARLGNPLGALENYIEAANYADESGYESALGSVYLTIADTYSVNENNDNARDYYRRAIALLRKTDDSLSLGSGLANAGDFYYRQEKLDTALIYFQESGTIFKAIDYPIGIGYYEGSLGMIYGKQGKPVEALEKLNECLEILEAEGDYYGVAAFLPFVSEIYEKQGKYDLAIRNSQRSLDIATEYRLKEQIRDANLQLSNLYELLGNTDESLKYYKQYTTYKDSLSNIGLVQQMARLRTNFEVDQKQSEVDLLEKEAEISELREKRQDLALYIAMGILVFAFLLAYGLFRRYKYIRKTRDVIEKEKSRSDELLKNILPEETADELKQYGRVKAKKFQSVSVMFADFVGFTSYSEKMSPEDLVKTVDYYFSRFDQAAEKRGVEKIKTMGDCYMCASGLPFPKKDHAVQMVRLACDMLDIISRDGYSEVTGFEMRLGIHSGPVVAGVVGTKKFAYDIWGDTVNIAARMESGSLPGRINITENTYLLIKDHFECEFRGMVQVKNKGMMKMYFVQGPLEGRAEALSGNTSQLGSSPQTH